MGNLPDIILCAFLALLMQQCTYHKPHGWDAQVKLTFADFL
ncbi:hypothetical protein RintRC_4979 [Richelia intracellularis]|nr:hypothetical protein RintRC_4979 [Richelia intracellularis]